jgi:hypothetical protein
MPKRSLFLLTICIALDMCPSFAQTGVEVIERHEEHSLASYKVIVPASGFMKENLLQLANGYIQSHDQVRFLDVGIHADRAAAQDSSGKGIFHVSYGRWKHEFENKQRESSMPAAELLKDAVGATLRIRYADGRIEEVALSGENAFHPTINGIRLNLLHVTIVRQGFGTAKRWVPILYLSVPKMFTAQEAGIFAESIFRISGVPNPEILLRSDQWFIFDPYYPWMNPFAFAEMAPSEAEAARSAEFLCKPAEPQGCHQISAGRAQ